MKKILIIALVMHTMSVFSQRIISKGDRYFNTNQFETAIKYYLIDKDSKNKKSAEHAVQKLADCYRIIGEFEKAEEIYRKRLKRKKMDPVNYLNYGLSLKSSAKYAEAKLQFEEYIKIKPEDLMGVVYLNSCDSAQKWLDETIGKEIKNIEKINTEYSEFSPFILNKKLFFSSSRTGSKQALISFDGGGEVHRLDLYNVDFNSISKKEISKNEIINFKEINTAMHEGAACFSKDGKELYFTKTVKGNRNEKTNDILNTLQIFYSQLDSNGIWSIPQSAFSFNSTQYSVGHPSLSADGKMIFFMSDMKGGFGKTDIYYSQKQENGKWGLPKNIGNSVNTFGYELFPYISESGVLYFSSNAHPGMGQLDVFAATYEAGVWNHVTNLKPPINSIGNDFGICFDESGSHGFISSDRFNGKGAEDIYSFSLDQPLQLFLKSDSIIIDNNFIFDDVKYKLLSVSDSVNSEFPIESSQIYFNLENNKPYQISEKKNGLTINKINLIKKFDYAGKIFLYEFKMSALPIKMSGILPSINNTIWENASLSLMHDNEQIETSKLNSDGSFELKTSLIPDTEYKLVLVYEDFNLK